MEETNDTTFKDYFSQFPNIKQLVGPLISYGSLILKAHRLRNLRRGVRSDAQLNSTETRFQKCSQSGNNGSKHPILSISVAYNVISCKKSKETLKKIKIADFTI